MPAIRIPLDEGEVRRTLERLAATASDLSPALRQIGELLVDSTKRRFVDGRAPDGTPWAPNSPVTVLEYLRRLGGTRTRSGGLSARGRRLAAGKRPLVGETRRLSTEIFYEARRDRLLLGSPLVYAAVQQFGARRGQFGTTYRGAPIPWGDVPPRPFLGISDEDARAILEVLEAHLRRTAGT